MAPVIMTNAKALSLQGFASLLLVALLMAANHVSARLAFDSGLDIASAVAVRSGCTALVVGLLLFHGRVPWRLNPQQLRGLLMVGLMIGAQSQLLYGAVSRLPVALALLAFNTYPLWAAGWNKLIYRQPAERQVLWTMPVILCGLALALDVAGATSGLGAQQQWAIMGEGVAFAMAAAASFGWVLVITEHETAGLDGKVRTFFSLVLACSVALAVVGWQGGPHWPQTDLGWLGLLGLTCLYGSGFTLMFTVLPKLGVAGNTAIMNAEPVFALALGWAILDQRIEPVQVVGALVVVGAVIFLGLRRQ
jgi:drug/metabolite transporter (DMT)-like permease